MDSLRHIKPDDMAIQLTSWEILSDIIGWINLPNVDSLLVLLFRLVHKLLPASLLKFEKKKIYNLSFYFNKEIRDEYQQRHPHSDNNLVRMNDVVFAIHGFIISLFVLLQSCVYKKHETQQISSFAASFVWLTVMGSVLVISTIHYGGAIWLDFMYYLSSVKLIVSFIKYLPQVWINYKRHSTQGWSIQYIIWDLSGGVLSIIQLLLDAYIDGDWSGIEGVRFLFDNVK
ncbi:hypothetical protein INT47_005021, partial [Mucor saturninus]